jgi:hypothetical protein
MLSRGEHRKKRIDPALVFHAILRLITSESIEGLGEKGK